MTMTSEAAQVIAEVEKMPEPPPQMEGWRFYPHLNAQVVSSGVRIEVENHFKTLGFEVRRQPPTSWWKGREYGLRARGLWLRRAV